MPVNVNVFAGFLVDKVAESRYTVFNRIRRCVMEKPRIHIIACGGTIAGKAATDADLISYKAGELTVQELLESVPELKKHGEITGEQLCNIDSSNMTEALWLALAERVQQLCDAPDVDGIVITHGTDTLEETAYFLNLTVHTQKPVVLVGSMRPATAVSADGPLNLLDAVRLAGCSDAGRYGVLIAMNGQIGGARYTTKTNTAHVDAFRSWEMGFLGYMQDGNACFYQSPVRLHTDSSCLSCRSCQALPRVEILYCYVGMPARLVHEAVAAGAKGIVVAGFGHGNMADPVKDALLQAQEEKRLIVVRTSRTGGGIVSPVDNYSTFIAGDSLSCQKAKILLQLALLQTQDCSEIQALFDRY